MSEWERFGKEICGNCACWKNGECWSKDSMDEEEAQRNEPTRYTRSRQTCEAFIMSNDLGGTRLRGCFWDRKTGKLDRAYLRTCVLSRLLKRKKIGQTRAIELAKEYHKDGLRGTIELWKEYHIKDMLP